MFNRDHLYPLLVLDHQKMHFRNPKRILMKLKVSLALLVLAVVSLAFKGKEKEQVRVQIIHNTGGSIVVYDTLFEKSKHYSAQDFIRSKGLEPESIDIIDLDAPTTQPANDVWVLRSDNLHGNFSFEHFEKNVEMLNDEDEVEVGAVRVIKTQTTTSSTTRAFVDGEEVQILPPGEHSENLQHFLDSALKDVNMAVGKDGQVHRTIKINGVTVEDGASKVIWSDSVNGEALLEKIDLKELEGKEGVQVKAFVISTETEIESDEPVNAEMVKMLSQEARALAPSFTIAMVSTVGGKKEKTQPKEDRSLKIDQLQFFPRPNNGVFTLAFDLAQQGDTQLRIVDIQGKEVYQETLQDFTGHYEKQMDLSSEPAGTYILSITQNGKRLAEKVIIH